MAEIIDGRAMRNTTLAANIEKVIHFEEGIDNLSLALIGSATLAYKMDSTISSTSDTSANILNSTLLATDFFKNNKIYDLHVISDANVQIQWDSPDI